MSAMDGNYEESRRVLITGPTGLVGNNLVRLLDGRRAHVRVLTRKSSDRRPLEGLAAEVVIGDVTDPASVDAAMEGRTDVIHAAGCVLLGWKNATLHESINHHGTRNVARAARRAGARMIHVSTINAVGVGTETQLANEEWAAAQNIPCPYVVSKRAADTAVLNEIEMGLDAVIVHPGLMFGPWDWKPSSGRMILEVARKFTPVAPSGGISVSDVRDVADGILSALHKAPTGRGYILAGHNLTYLDLWRRIAELTGGGRPVCHSSPSLGCLVGLAGDLRGWVTRREPLVNSASVKLSECYHYFDSTRSRQELGYQNRPLEESLRDAWQWFREHGYVTSHR